MELYPDTYYHIFNRSNNKEVVFKTKDNYRFFLGKFYHYFGKRFQTICYCLMPTHFHFLAYVNPLGEEDEAGWEEEIDMMKRDFGILLSSHTKAINKRYGRHGSLFQSHTKTRPVTSESHLAALVDYIHQNPVRARLVRRLEDWEFSSYRDYLGLRTDRFLFKEVVLSNFKSIEEFRIHSNQILESLSDADGSWRGPLG
ncbi:MAG: hypothetical protein WBD36_03240 [Bacteroidota bacterium]